jgi:hypothetical protein
MRITIKLFLLITLPIFFVNLPNFICAANDSAINTGTSVSGDATTGSLTATAEPQYGSVFGRVFELGSPDTIEYAQVQAKGTSLTTESDAKGRYKIKLPAGDRALIFNADGYAERIKNISLKPGQDMELNVNLEKVDFTSSAVVIKAKKEIDQTVASTINQVEIKKTPGNGGDALRAVQSLPGVAAPNDFSGELVVQGGGPDDNLYLLNNIPWPVPFHFFGMLATVDSDLLSSVDLNAAGFGVKWGDCMGAVLDAQTTAGRKDRLHVTVDINMIMSQALVEGPLGIGDASFTLAGRRSYIDLLLKGYLDSMGFTVVPAFWDAAGTLDFTLGPNNHFKGMVQSSDDFMSLNQTEDEVNNPAFAGNYSINSSGFTSGMSWVNTSLQGIISTLTPYYFRNVQQNTTGATFQNTGEDNFGIKEEAVWDIGELLGMKNELGFGGNLGMIDESDNEYNFKYYSPNTETYADLTGATINSRLFERGIYLQDNIQINKQWAFIPGVRYDKRDDVAHDTLLPRLRLEFQYDDSTLWKAAWGYYSQFPNAEEMNPELGNPSLSANIAEHIVLSVEKKFSASLTGSMDVYYKTYTDLVTGVTTPGAVEAYNNNGFGIAKGIDFFLQERADRFFAWASYSLSNSERLDPNTGLWSLYEFDQPNIANLVGGYNITPAWSISGKMRYNSGPLQQSLLGRFLDSSGIWHPVFSDTYNMRLGDYLRFDLRTDYSLLFEGWKLNLYFEIINALNRANPQGLMFSPDYSMVSIINNLPRLMYFGLEAEF